MHTVALLGDAIAQPVERCHGLGVQPVLVFVDLLLPAGELFLHHFCHRALQFLPRGALEPVEHATTVAGP